MAYIPQKINIFKNLPFALNKGEALIIESDKYLPSIIYKKGITVSADWK